MVFRCKPKETKDFKIKTCFAIFPKRIDDKIVWLQRYYKTWDWVGGGLYGWYAPTFYITKEEAELHVKFKQEIQVK